MNRINIFHALRSGRFFAALIALLGLGLSFTVSPAKGTGCGLLNKIDAAPSIPFVSPQQNESLNHQEGEESNKHASIVGLWHLIYTAESESGAPIFPPAPFQFLESFKTWHADGTEFENAFLAPAGGNICFGVWKDTGDNSVKLHHIGLMFDAEGKVSFIFTTDETNTVSGNGRTYKGKFTFKLWPPFFDEVGVGTPLQEISGTTAGTRISVD